MTLEMVRPKTKTEDLLLSLTKNCETLNKRPHRKPEETLKSKLNQPR